MMKVGILRPLALAVALTTWPSAAHAIMAMPSLDTVNWAPDSAVDGTGTGTLAGSNTVTYLTDVGGNAGTTIADNWDTSLATNGAVGSGATFLTGGVLGTFSEVPSSLKAADVQTITFSAAVTNPILLVNFADPTSTMDFGTQSLTVLQTHNAQFAAGVFTFVGATGSFDDGFAAQINGTFGPGSPITFDYTTLAAFDSVGFTVGATSAVPEPSSFVMAGSGLLIGVIYALRRRREATV